MGRLAIDLGISESDDVYPADHFDLMGGVGFGGCVWHPLFKPNLTGDCRLVALMLGHF
jgi:hypothetical protein